MKRKAHIAKTQSQLPLKNINKLIGKDEIQSQEVNVDDFAAVAENGVTQVVKEQVLSNEESDYEDMMTPTDDEGATSLNHT